MKKRKELYFRIPRTKHFIGISIDNHFEWLSIEIDIHFYKMFGFHVRILSFTFSMFICDQSFVDHFNEHVKESQKPVIYKMDSKPGVIE